MMLPKHYTVGDPMTVITRRGDVVTWHLIVEASTPRLGWDVLTVDDAGEIIEEHALWLPLRRAYKLARGLERQRAAWQAEMAGCRS